MFIIAEMFDVFLLATRFLVSNHHNFAENLVIFRVIFLAQKFFGRKCAPSIVIFLAPKIEKMSFSLLFFFKQSPLNSFCDDESLIILIHFLRINCTRSNLNENIKTLPWHLDVLQFERLNKNKKGAFINNI